MLNVITPSICPAFYSLKHVLLDVKEAGHELLVSRGGIEFDHSADTKPNIELITSSSALPDVLTCLRKHNIYAVAGSIGNGGSGSLKCLGYQNRGASIIQLKLTTELTAGITGDTRVYFKNTSNLFGAVCKLSGRVSAAIQCVVHICNAALLPSYRGRARRKLLQRAIACARHSDLLRINTVSDILTGSEATRYLNKIVQTEIWWEVELFLSELQRELAKASEVEFFARAKLQLPGKRSFRDLSRLSDREASPRRAPLIAIVQKTDNADLASRLALLLDEHTECRAMSFSQNLPAGISGAGPGGWGRATLRVLQPVVTRMSSYFRYRTMDRLLEAGVIVLINGDSPAVTNAGNCTAVEGQYRPSDNQLLLRSGRVVTMIHSDHPAEAEAPARDTDVYGGLITQVLRTIELPSG